MANNNIIPSDKQSIASAKSKPNSLKALLDIAAILYQVNDLKLAMDMILDTLTEILQVRMVGVALPDAILEEFHILYQRNIEPAFTEVFSFNPYKLMNGHAIHENSETMVRVSHGRIEYDDQNLQIDERIKQILIYPVRFHEQTIAYFILPSLSEGAVLNEEQKKMLEVFSIISGPVLFAFEIPLKSKKSFENIISKIIKDRVYESRLALTPISFVVFRINIKKQMADSLILEQAISEYQNEFKKVLCEKGDLIWLAADTAFFIYPNADLFTVETLSSQLTEKIKNITLIDNSNEVFLLKYACISYPQSGDNAREIINQLWLKLFEELYLMET